MAMLAQYVITMLSVLGRGSQPPALHSAAPSVVLALLTMVLPPFQPQKGKLTPSPVDFTITPETLQNVKEVFVSQSHLCVVAFLRT